MDLFSLNTSVAVKQARKKEVIKFTHDQLKEWNFRESVNEARTTYHGQAKGGKGKFSSEFFTKILKHFGAYFQLHQSNHAGLGIFGKVLFSFTI